jgi:soluble methane monooxygenase-binding protein MmoD
MAPETDRGAQAMGSKLFDDDCTEETFPGAADADADTGFAASVQGVEIYREGRYRAFTQDVECMWRWEIHRDEEIVQVGCSLSEGSSREAVAHVISFYQRRDSRLTDQEGPQIGGG